MTDTPSDPSTATGGSQRAKPNHSLEDSSLKRPIPACPEDYRVFREYMRAYRKEAKKVQWVEGCPVYGVPAEGSSDGPVGQVRGGPLSLTILILKMEDALSHTYPDLVVSKQKIIEYWNDTIIPGDHPVPAAPNAEHAVPWQDAASMINVARKHGIPQILQRAFYEVAANKDFWDVHNAGSVKVDLPKDDLDRLLGMRLYLDLQWPKYMAAAPRIDDVGRVKPMPDGTDLRCDCDMSIPPLDDSWRRKDKWLEFALCDESMSVGAQDALRYNLVEQRREILTKTWCEGCLRDKEDAWKSLRAEWWGALGEIVKT